MTVNIHQSIKCQLNQPCVDENKNVMKRTGTNKTQIEQENADRFFPGVCDCSQHECMMDSLQIFSMNVNCYEQCRDITLHYIVASPRSLITNRHTKHVYRSQQYSNALHKPVMGFVPWSSPFGDNHSTRKSAAPEAWTLKTRIRHHDEKS